MIEPAHRRMIKNLIRRGFQILDTRPINQGRYIIVIAEPYNILITYKRDFFNSFGKIFSHLGMSGLGDTINTEHLKLAVQNNVKEIYTIFASGRAYSIPLDVFLIKSVKWTNKAEKKEVRSISIKEYKDGRDI